MILQNLQKEVGTSVQALQTKNQTTHFESKYFELQIIVHQIAGLKSLGWFL